MRGARSSYNGSMIQEDKAFIDWQFGVKSILLAQHCIKRRVGFGDKNSARITREKIDVVGEFEILVIISSVGGSNVL